jgi:SAM-dependent methyltransferase
MVLGGSNTWTRLKVDNSASCLENRSVAERSGRGLGRSFDEVPELYDRVRPVYPDEMLRDLATIGGLTAASDVLEVGSGTGQATQSLAPLVRTVTAVEPGVGMMALARRRLAHIDNVRFETSTFEQWDAHDRRFDAIVAASSWHWVDQPIGWNRAYDLLRPGGWMALAGHVVVRRPGEAEVYAATADLHQHYSPDNPDWSRPPLEEDVSATSEGWGLVPDPGPLFGPTLVRFYPTMQTFDGAGFADLLRTQSPYRRLASDVREQLLAAVAERIQHQMHDVAHRRYLSVLRMGQRSE